MVYLSPSITLQSIIGLLTFTCPLIKNNFYPTCTKWTTEIFDFIIVGGGTAGCTLANRLTENGDWKVLLIEDGDYPSEASEIPLDFLTLQQTKEDWAFKTEPADTFMGSINQSNNWPQGRALGGSSTINAMLNVPGVPFDYDTWGNLVDLEWSYDNVKPYFTKLYKMVHITPFSSERIGRLFIEFAANIAGFGFNKENSIFGFRDVELTTKDNTRFSMAEAYIKPIKNRKNLCVVVNKRVNKIIIEDETAKGVEIQGSNGPFNIYATKEVIVTAGAINSPKLLMLSGIGPTEHLQELNITVHKNLPVGQNLEDHLSIPLFGPMIDIPMLPHALLKAIYCATGLLLNNANLANVLGFFNTEGETTHPNIEFIQFQFLSNDDFYLEAYFKKFGIIEQYAKQLRDFNKLNGVLLFLPTLLHPKSRGYLELSSTNPAHPPRITPNYLAFKEDVDVLYNGIQQVYEKLMKTIPFSLPILKPIMHEFRFKMSDTCDNEEYKSYEYWECYFKTFATTIYHPSGTCRMGKNEVDSVVASNLTVWGIKNLRVADSSAIPKLISGHTNIPTCMIAEKAADIIKLYYK